MTRSLSLEIGRMGYRRILNMRLQLGKAVVSFWQWGASIYYGAYYFVLNLDERAICYNKGDCVDTIVEFKLCPFKILKYHPID